MIYPPLLFVRAVIYKSGENKKELEQDTQEIRQNASSKAKKRTEKILSFSYGFATRMSRALKLSTDLGWLISAG